MKEDIPGGYAGKLLRIDLSKERVTEERLDESTLRKYVGGAGFGAMYLYAEVPPDVDWSDPENRLIFATGPLGATQIPGSGTYSVATKGTLTGGASFGQANGFFGAFLKRSGLDGIIVQGAAKRPIYLHVHDGSAELRDAGHLSGKDTFETDDMIKEELGKTESAMSVMGIGPAGENLVKYAAIVGDKGHVAGHNGMGAVMGSKKLKAIAVERGKNKFSIADPQRLSTLAKAIFQEIKKDKMGNMLYQYGTLGTYGLAEKFGALPIKNYTTNVYPDKEKLSQFTPEYIRERFQPRPNPCWACRMHHCHESTITEGPYKGLAVEEPEFECLSAMGPQIGNMEVASAMMLIDLVDRLGLEINETGWVIGLAMECYEKGLITKDDTQGIDMTWGHVEGVKAMLHKIAQREAFGDVLAHGARAAAQIIGGDASNFAVHTMKGNTPRGYDHRAFWAEMFDKLTSNTGTLESRPTAALKVGEALSPDEVVAITTSGKGRMSFVDTLGVCYFSTLGNVPLLAEAVSAVTGWDFGAEEAESVGLRIVNMARVYNYRLGHTRALEAPSPRYGSTPKDGPFAGNSIMPQIDQMLDLYYEKMGWEEETGKPLPITLKSLGLDHIIGDIW